MPDWGEEHRSAWSAGMVRDREVALDKLHIAGMPPVYDRWLNGVVPTWMSLGADGIDALRGMPP